MRGLIRHTWLTLRLNGRNRMAVAYGYLIPVLFVFAFAAVFRSSPRLLGQMGQLLTIGVLGGACFGLPTGLVADRERGLWRRYQLLPGSAAGLVVSTMVARFVIVASSAAVQVAVAWLAFRTPLPVHPVQLAMAFVAVAFAFEGLGLVIAAVADTVPAVQALGQAVFLPVIIVGGVGVPVTSLPAWAQRVAAFLPGRYAVEVLQPCVSGGGLGDRWFQLLALVVIGAAGCAVGGKLFRWDAHQRLPIGRLLWATPAVAAWAAVGLAAVWTGHDRPAVVAQVIKATSRPVGGPWDALTDAQIAAIPVTGLPPDDDTRVSLNPPGDSPVPEERERIDTVREKLNGWPPAYTGRADDRVRAVLSLAAITDLMMLDPLAGYIGRLAFDRLQGDYPPDDLRRLLAWIILHPDDGTVQTAAPSLGLDGPCAEVPVRERVTMYAQKLLGRLEGKLPDVQPASP